MRNKNGLSKIVGAALLILLALALVLLLWMYLMNFLKIDMFDMCLDGGVSVVDSCYSEGDKEIYITIQSKYGREVVDYFNPGITFKDGSDAVFASWRFGEEVCGDVRMSSGEYGIPIVFPDYQSVYVVSYDDADIRDLIPERVKLYYSIKEGTREIACSVISEKEIVECAP